MQCHGPRDRPGSRSKADNLQGHDLLAFRERFPNLKSEQVILQEQAHVVNRINLDNVRVMEHDFYHLQPIKGEHAKLRCLDLELGCPIPCVRM